MLRRTPLSRERSHERRTRRESDQAGAGGIVIGSAAGGGGTAGRPARLAVTTSTPSPNTAPRNHRSPPRAATDGAARRIAQPTRKARYGLVGARTIRRPRSHTDVT